MGQITLFDCTLRDGANAVPNGFSRKQAELILEGLLSNGIDTIEIGGSKGLGGVAPDESLNDQEYLEMAQPFTRRGTIGIFLNIKNATTERIREASDAGMKFIRIGAAAGDGFKCYEAIQQVKACGIACEYSLMKSYLLPPADLAREARVLESCGLDRITVMDSAGTMLPEDVRAYVEAIRQEVRISVAFHGHNNLGLSHANALTALEAGADTLDCCLLGLARSAGNGATEILSALLARRGMLKTVNIPGLLGFVERQLLPELGGCDESSFIRPEDVICGIAGCHSSFLSLFREMAVSHDVPLYDLIERVSVLDRKSPSRELMEAEALALVEGRA
ncbi:4-hydroxy-2-oxovalerate aldolase [Hominifimenecus sp. rT4P-3]|uniref:4-hydroxy-2-oxovalerate aldolase n=1 Tax=Hominifimenecus sp. rT4P-3 TaxID=3242979 RepID=UPI003DA20AFA